MVTVGALAVAAGAAFGVHQATQAPTVTGAAAQGAAQPATFLPRYGQSFGGFSDGTGGGSPWDGTSDRRPTARPPGDDRGHRGPAGRHRRDQHRARLPGRTGRRHRHGPHAQRRDPHQQPRGRRRHAHLGHRSPAPGRRTPATVVGTDPTDDVAVLRLAGASGLQTAHLSTGDAAVGEAVTGVGNAGGTGSLTAAAGSITALDQSITASDEGTGGNSEQLTGLIQTDAAIQAGDSGGPLYGADGTVIGMDTAASSGGAAEGYAIPIATAEPRRADRVRRRRRDDPPGLPGVPRRLAAGRRRRGHRRRRRLRRSGRGRRYRGRRRDHLGRRARDDHSRRPELGAWPATSPATG